MGSKQDDYIVPSFLSPTWGEINGAKEALPSRGSRRWGAINVAIYTLLSHSPHSGVHSMQLHNRYFLVPNNMGSNHCGYKTFAFSGSQSSQCRYLNPAFLGSPKCGVINAAT